MATRTDTGTEAVRSVPLELVYDLTVPVLVRH